MTTTPKYTERQIEAALQWFSDEGETVSTPDAIWSAEHEPMETEVGKRNAQRLGEKFILTPVFAGIEGPSRAVFTKQCTPHDVEYAIVSLFVRAYENAMDAAGEQADAQALARHHGGSGIDTTRDHLRNAGRA